MKVIMVMFDSLNRRFLPPYGGDWTEAPNFSRLARRAATFDNCYAGSMPCMPARRELHTGRYNFLHRSWGPLEPFDDSIPEMLKENGVYSHLVTDHQHYWEDGGATYHSRYSSFEFFRGQEGDPWKGHVQDPPGIPGDLKRQRDSTYRQDLVNRQYMKNEADHPQTRTFDAGLGFITTNKDSDNWFLQIETFDPHEPFFSYDQYRKYYEHEYTGPHFDWPDYKRVIETPEQVQHARSEYAALLTMCDRSLGRVLDAMDEHAMWEDTLLLVCTDHGFLLGEHGWWGKNVQPWYDETIRTPLFVWDPRSGIKDQRRESLVQTIDLGPTVLDAFGIPPTSDMQGLSLSETVRRDSPVRESALFGIFGGHACITDGRYVYMRASVDESNEPLFEHTLMPNNMRQRFPVEVLRQAELVEPFPFTKEAPLLRMPGESVTSPWAYGTLLFDLQEDPHQQHPIIDDTLEQMMAEKLRDLLVESQAPPSQFHRLGLPPNGPLTQDDLLIRRHWAQTASTSTGLAGRAQFPQRAAVSEAPPQIFAKKL
ncbi:sulfatase [Arthrobacter sp. S39]|nr:sulfatase [Arthrobacter sp. S39]